MSYVCAGGNQGFDGGQEGVVDSPEHRHEFKFSLSAIGICGGRGRAVIVVPC